MFFLKPTAPSHKHAITMPSSAHTRDSPISLSNRNLKDAHARDADLESRGRVQMAARDVQSLAHFFLPLIPEMILPYDQRLCDAIS
jgi:hypothetical protein